MLKRSIYSIVVVLVACFSLTSCLTAKKLDLHVAEQFGNKLPKPDKRNDSNILVISSIPSDPEIISVTKKSSKSLPLIVYWKYDYRHTCVLNPAIGLNYFKKTVNQQANKIKLKLNGQQLELKVEKIPHSFAIVDKGHILLLLIHWHKLYVEPDPQNLVVSYRVLQNGSETRSGQIIVPNTERNKGIRFAQSWKSSSSEFLAQYNPDINEMTRTAINKLLDEL